jgi:UDP-N-acetylglucosamine 4-epimerase
MYHIPYHGDKDLSQISFLVIGGAGFIGSNIVNYLLKFGAGKVRVLDNFSSGSTSNLENFSFFTSFELIKGDIKNLSDCKRAMDGIDVILNEVALDAEFSSNELGKTHKDIQINGFLNILIASKYAGVKRIVFSSSSSASPVMARFNDSKDLITKSLSPYLVKKYVNELYASVFCRLYDLDYIGLRYFNVFGPGQIEDNTDSSIIPKFINSNISGICSTIIDDSDRAIDFNYIENVVQANVLAACIKEPAALNQNYNIASGELITLSELSNYLKQTLAIRAPISDLLKFRQPIGKKAKIPCSYISITKAISLLNYKPYFSIRDGIEETLKISKTEVESIITD